MGYSFGGWHVIWWGGGERSEAMQNKVEQSKQNEENEAIKSSKSYKVIKAKPSPAKQSKAAQNQHATSQASNQAIQEYQRSTER